MSDRDKILGGDRRSHGAGKDVLGKCFLVTWAVTFVVGLAVLEHYKNTELTKRWGTFAPADMIDVGGTLGGFNAALCQHVRVFSSSDAFTIYLLPQLPLVYSSDSLSYDVSDTFSAKPVGIHKRAFYLHNGSTVNTSACFPESQHLPPTKTEATVFVFKGSKAFQDWVSQNETCQSCALQSHNLDSSQTCANNTPFMFSLKIQETNNYYFAFKFVPDKSLNGSRSINAVFNLDETEYNLTKAEVFCEDQTICDVPLNTTLNQGIVAKFGKRQDSMIYLSSFCQTRLSVWLNVVLVAPLAIGLVVVLVVFGFTTLIRRNKYD